MSMRVLPQITNSKWQSRAVQEGVVQYQGCGLSPARVAWCLWEMAGAGRARPSSGPAMAQSHREAAIGPQRQLPEGGWWEGVLRALTHCRLFY